MRITNQMMTNNALYNINKNKTNLSKLEEQYASGKKIQRPSEDPIVAVRALKLRSNLTMLDQYVEKNIPDALSWMDSTESALNNVNTLLTEVTKYCVQGSNDTLTVADRTSIVQNLEEIKKQIYQEGDANYAGRYVFTGYKTDTSLVMPNATTNLEYTITEKLSGTSVEGITKVIGAYAVGDYDATTASSGDFSTSPTKLDTYRMQLSYENLSDIGGITYTKSDGTVVTLTSSNIVTKSENDADAYVTSAGKFNYIPETGELIIPDDMYDELRLASDVSVTYDKNSFEAGDLRPEHYFDCTMVDTSKPEEGTKTYTKSDQQIQYEINFNQKLTVNTQASDAFSHDIGREIDGILAAVQDVAYTESKISEVEKLLADTNLTTDQTASLNALLEQLNTELVLKNGIMQDKFENGIEATADYKDTVNEAVSSLGSRYARLELTQSRLETQQVYFEDLLSTNEDADVAETIVRYTSAENIYNASLSAASKVVKNTLLDFL